MRISDWSSDVCSSDLVDIALRLAIGGGHARLDQLRGIGAALVAQRVETGGDQQRRRQAFGREIERRGAIVGGVGGVMIAEPRHAALRQPLAFADIAVALPVVVPRDRSEVPRLGEVCFPMFKYSMSRYIKK